VTVNAPPDFDCDVAIVGSGFGGAVSALRLAEKGYDVVVLEQGRRLSPEDILKARSSARDHLWEPDLGLRGFFWQRVFRDVGIIGAAGVGGGSIVWGGVLLKPGPAVFEDPAWGTAEPDWGEALENHYEEAARMLGRTTNPFIGEMDEHLRTAARAVGGEETFGPVPLAIYFGEPGETVKDPFFDGEGPDRTGCRLCGGCLSGCPYNAKNTLDKNYLHLAERRGARILTEHRVESVAALPGGGYELKSTNPWQGHSPPPLRAGKVILAAGVLGTLDLLFRCRDELGTLPRVSNRLGKQVRTNSEAVTAIVSDDPAADLSRGPAISTDFYADARTHVTQNRYVGGGKLLRPQVGPLVDGSVPLRRAVRTIGEILRHPLRQASMVFARNFEERFTALTVMQNLDNELSFQFGRSPLRPWKRVLRSRAVKGREAPTYLPEANEVTRAFAEASQGRAMNLLAESVGGISFTAHILGGAVIGESAEEGVIDGNHEVHGHPGLYVADASAIPVNLGVNPSLTITAMAERFADRWPGKDEARNRKDEAAGRTGHVPQAGMSSEDLPRSPLAIKRLWKALPAPGEEALEGTHRAIFVGPAPLRALAPRGLAVLGLPGWYGKRFQYGEDGLTGVNLLEQDGAMREYLEMRVAVEPSCQDGAPALVVTYPSDAPLPWREVRDEFRLLGPGELLGMTVVDRPGGRALGTPFLLRREHPSAQDDNP